MKWQLYIPAIAPVCVEESELVELDRNNIVPLAAFAKTSSLCQDQIGYGEINVDETRGN